MLIKYLNKYHPHSLQQLNIAKNNKQLIVTRNNYYIVQQCTQIESNKRQFTMQNIF
jgi:hypothetical protein